MHFKQYQRKGLSEMIQAKLFTESMDSVSVSEADKALSNEEFMEGYIARNPLNHEDKWYVSKKYFDENLTEVPEPVLSPGHSVYYTLEGVHLVKPLLHLRPVKRFTVQDGTERRCSCIMSPLILTQPKPMLQKTSLARWCLMALTLQ